MSGKYRILHTSFWNEDPDMYELTPEQKYFYIYILTGPQTKQCGVSKFSIKIAADQTGYNTDTISKLIKLFQEEYGKIKYNPETKELAIKNWARWNYQGKNPKVEICIQKELLLVKDQKLIEYVWGEKYENEEFIKPPRDNGKDELRKLQNKSIELIFEHWKKIMKHPKAILSEERKKKIRARLNDGYSFEQCIKAINGCAASSYHMGNNEGKTVYDSIDLIFRNASKIESFMARDKRVASLVGSIAGKAKEDNYDWKGEYGEE